jgi:hypothetical protein
MNTLHLADTYLGNRIRREKRALRAVLHPDVVLADNIPRHVLPFGGAAEGRSAVLDRIQTVWDIFDLLDAGVRPRPVPDASRHPNRHRFSLQYVCRHRQTLRTLKSSVLCDVTICDGAVVDLWEQHDVNLVTAFMRSLSRH